MFGMMFGDAGHGPLLVLAGLLLRSGLAAPAGPVQRGSGRSSSAPGSRPAASACSTASSSARPGWSRCSGSSPLEEPVTLLAVALGVGAVLLAGAYVLGTVNRWREGGWALALSAPSGIAGGALFLGLGLVVLGVDRVDDLAGGDRRAW